MISRSVIVGVLVVGCWTSHTDVTEPRTVAPRTAGACTGNAECGAGSLCVAFVTTVGPRSSVGRECRANPCGSAPLDCTCARPVCAGHGAGYCSLPGGNVTCDDGRQ
jgi:hypothetical protein